jgi:amino acid permease
MSVIANILIICCFLLGVYSQHYANGGIQCFFIGFVNLYVYALCVLNYPVFVKKEEFQEVEVVNNSVREVELQDYQANRAQRPDHVVDGSEISVEVKEDDVQVLDESHEKENSSPSPDKASPERVQVQF